MICSQLEILSSLEAAVQQSTQCVLLGIPRHALKTKPAKSMRASMVYLPSANSSVVDLIKHHVKALTWAPAERAIETGQSAPGGHTAERWRRWKYASHLARVELSLRLAGRWNSPWGLYTRLSAPARPAPRPRVRSLSTARQSPS